MELASINCEDKGTRNHILHEALINLGLEINGLGLVWLMTFSSQPIKPPSKAVNNGRIFNLIGNTIRF